LPVSKTAEKEMRVAERRSVQNKAIKTGVKSKVNKAEKLIEAGDLDAARTQLVSAASALDKAADKGIIHRNNAARHKSRLAKKLNKATAGTAKAAKK
jgi:small subunit ribosomal protein S20